MFLAKIKNIWLSKTFSGFTELYSIRYQLKKIVLQDIIAAPSPHLIQASDSDTGPPAPMRLYQDYLKPPPPRLVRALRFQTRKALAGLYY